MLLTLSRSFGPAGRSFTRSSTEYSASFCICFVSITRYMVLPANSAGSIPPLWMIDIVCTSLCLAVTAVLAVSGAVCLVYIRSAKAACGYHLRISEAV